MPDIDTNTSHIYLDNYYVDIPLLKHNNNPNFIPLQIIKFFLSKLIYNIVNIKFYSILFN